MPSEKVWQELCDILKESRNVSRDGVANEADHPAADVRCTENRFPELTAVLNLAERCAGVAPLLKDAFFNTVETVESMAVADRRAQIERDQRIVNRLGADFAHLEDDHGFDNGRRGGATDRGKRGLVLCLNESLQFETVKRPPIQP